MLIWSLYNYSIGSSKWKLNLMASSNQIRKIYIESQGSQPIPLAGAWPISLVVLLLLSNHKFGEISLHWSHISDIKVEIDSGKQLNYQDDLI